ncbi:uncharacterized protein LOC106661141 isoform X2 [Cimex lectularius]|uniref:Uncharacterized protein n=1 Tax=Cimex lectularius TaxID=79782 RepID=A0A8I6R7F0_CIMLE|nr:uncharacterized protein LOC106661141 isoform X2 [Cimex lectularius]
MPLRWRMPTDDEASDLYRRIDQLIADLFNLIRSILLGPPAIQQNDENQENAEGRNVPDLLANISSGTKTDDPGEPPPPPPAR